MKTLTLLISLLFMSYYCYSQVSKQEKEPEYTIGIVSSEEETRIFGQQIALQGVTGTRYTIIHRYLTVAGEKFKLYKYSEDEIKNFEKNLTLQTPFWVLAEDYYLKEKEQENGKYCLFTGIINKEKGMIYSASLVEVYNENKIIEALMNYSQEKIKQKKN